VSGPETGGGGRKGIVIQPESGETRKTEKGGPTGSAWQGKEKNEPFVKGYSGV